MFQIQANNITIGYGSRAVLRDVSLEAASGEVVGLIGPNGSGKSTLLKALSGVLPPASGEITAGGKSISRMSRHELARLVAVVPQNPALPEAFTVFDIILMGRYPHLGLLRYEGKHDLAVAWEALEKTGLEELAQRRAGELSGGERQRLLIARALAQEAQAILLDEPTAHLDIQHQLEVIELVRGLARGRVAAIAALHDFTLAARFCDRLLLLSGGTVFAEGSPSEVVTPQNLKAAFGVNALVYHDHLADRLSVTALTGSGETRPQRIHIIGGGGRAAGLMRKLHTAGFTITTGVLNQGDTDCTIAEALGIQSLVIPPFAAIDRKSHAQNLGLVAGADCTILADVPFGRANALNLEAAATAKRLVLIDDTPIEERDFTGGHATNLYRHLKKRAAIVTSENVFATVSEILETEGREAWSRA